MSTLEVGGDSSHRKIGVLMKMLNGNVMSELILCVRSCKFYPNLTSGFTLTKTVTLQDVPLLNVTSRRLYAMAKVTILVWEYPENYQK